MNGEYLFHKEDNHMIFISSGNYEMSFKRFFLKKIINLPDNKLPPGVYESDKNLNIFLRNQKYLLPLSNENIEECKFCPVKIKSHSEIFPKNCKNKTLKTLPSEKVLQPTVANPMNYDYDFSMEPLLNRNKMTLILHDPLERLIFIFFKYFLLLVFREKESKSFIGSAAFKFLEVCETTLDKFSFNIFLKNLNKNMSKLLKEPELHQLICHQTLENELLWEKFENLANLLIITTDDINALFPGYEDFFRRDNVLGSLTTMERLSRVKGINDLVNMLAPFITRNHIRSGSFVEVRNTNLMDLYQRDINFHKKYLGKFDKHARQYFITGQVRSGTSYVCKILGKYLDSPDCYLNETGQRAPHLRWKLRGSFFVFKYCEDFLIFDEIKNYFPNSEFIYVVRDIRDQIYSILHPSTKSWPPRKTSDFPSINALQEYHNCSLFQAICLFLTWKHNDEIEPILDKLHKQNYSRTVRYEDLLNEKGILEFVKSCFPNRAKEETETIFSGMIKKVNFNSWDKYSLMEKKYILWNSSIIDYLLKYKYLTKSDIPIMREQLENMELSEKIIKNEV